MQNKFEVNVKNIRIIKYFFILVKPHFYFLDNYI